MLLFLPPSTHAHRHIQRVKNGASGEEEWDEDTNMRAHIHSHIHHLPAIRR